MKKYFLDLFEYNNWANERIIMRIQENNSEYKVGSPLSILSHIIAAQDTWLERVKGTKSYNIFLWEDNSIQELEILSFNSHKSWIKFLNKFNEDRFSEFCNYKNSSGVQNQKKYQDIFTHVLNHSSYHRGQINQLLRLNSIEPPVTDFIYYC
jgi:uncharacterized damage-inducible protein DinB